MRWETETKGTTLLADQNVPVRGAEPVRRRWWSAAAAAGVLPVLAGLFIVSTTFGGTSMIPWQAGMVDLGVYRRAGQVLLAGGDIYQEAAEELPFVYPPFAALLAAPLALVPTTVIQIGWTIASVLTLLAILHRCGLRGSALILVATAVVLICEPVRQTLAFGQLSLFLAAMVILDLAPGPRLARARRLLPEGLLTGLASAIKLTPAIFVLYLMASRKWRTAAVAGSAAAAVTVLAAILLPGSSWSFWGGLARGETGMSGGIIYAFNQSLLANVARIVGLGRVGLPVGLGLAVLVGLMGAWAASLWQRRGQTLWALSLAGLAGLMASPVSWLNHFVWVVPLALCLAGVPQTAGRATVRIFDQPRWVPGWFRVLGWLLVGWVTVAPFQRLPSGENAELGWSWWQLAVGSVTAVLGVSVLLASIVVVRRAPPGPG